MRAMLLLLHLVTMTTLSSVLLNIVLATGNTVIDIAKYRLKISRSSFKFTL